jgi:hypothetical protein
MVDDDIVAIFAAVSEDIKADLAAVIGEATRQGRRRRARRRLAIACTASASVVAIAVAATVAAHLASAGVHGAPPVGHGGHRHTRLVTPKVHHTRPAVPQAHGPGMRPSQMLAVLRTLLPSGTVTYVAPPPFSERGSLELNFDDRKGAVDIIVSVSLTPDPLQCPIPPLTDEAKRPVGALPISCTTSVLPNGDVVMPDITGDDFAGYYDLAVYVARPDGVTVSIAVGNGTLQGTPHHGKQGWPWVDRAVPPGSVAFWKSVAASPKWHL